MQLKNGMFWLIFFHTVLIPLRYPDKKLRESVPSTLEGTTMVSESNDKLSDKVTDGDLELWVTVPLGP